MQYWTTYNLLSDIEEWYTIHLSSELNWEKQQIPETWETRALTVGKHTPEVLITPKRKACMPAEYIPRAEGNQEQRPANKTSFSLRWGTQHCKIIPPDPSS